MKRQSIFSRNQKSVVLYCSALLMILSSCSSVSYMVRYHTYLEGDPNESLEYNDSIMKVKFDPRPNGIKFDIENLSKNNLYLIWDKSYFIEPDGSSSKALNTDVLATKKEIRDMENYESVIPQRSHFDRFTASSTKVSEFTSNYSLTLYNELTKSINTSTYYSKFYETGTYWYLGSKQPFSSKNELSALDKQEIQKIKRLTDNQNNLALGFTIKNIDEELEYHFKFPIKSVEIFKKTSNEPNYRMAYELNKSNNFNPSTELYVEQEGEWINILCTKCNTKFKVKGIGHGTIKCPQCGTLNYY